MLLCKRGVFSVLCPLECNIAALFSVALPHQRMHLASVPRKRRARHDPDGNFLAFILCLLEIGYKNNSQQELLSRLRLAAPNDTICLSRTYAFRSYVCRSGVNSTGAVFIYFNNSAIIIVRLLYIHTCISSSKLY